ncbi:S-adenosyl-L-methionine-dependent methyltransferase [Mycena amicta]|nr:S-adenosyl-L-methionine-dependent methyltransferase [Mycena amicta]
MALARLAATLGARQAALELKWMKKASKTALTLDEMVARRVAGEPLQYILGTQPFGPLNLLCRSPTLCPRSETEDWSLRLADLLQNTTSPNKRRKVLDLGTGTGCVALLLCRLLPPGSLTTFGVDISLAAVELAQENAMLTGFAGTQGNTFRALHASFLDPLFPQPHLGIQPPFDVVTSNPPYISWHDYLRLPSSVREYEDPKALFGGPEGLDFYHAIARLVSTKGFLNPGALVAVEVGDGQAEQVERIFHSVAQVKSTIWLDPWGKQRTVLLQPID